MGSLALLQIPPKRFLSFAQPIAPRRPDIPMTPESIRLALEARDAERLDFEQATGLKLDADGRVIGARS